MVFRFNKLSRKCWINIRRKSISDQKEIVIEKTRDTIVSLISKQRELLRIVVGEDRGIERPSVPLSRKLPSPPSTFDRSKASYRETAGESTRQTATPIARPTKPIASQVPPIFRLSPRCNEFLNALYRGTHLSSGVPLTSLRYRSLLLHSCRFPC